MNDPIKAKTKISVQASGGMVKTLPDGDREPLVSAGVGKEGEVAEERSRNR